MLKRMLPLIGMPLLVCALFAYIFTQATQGGYMTSVFSLPLLVTFILAMCLVVNVVQISGNEGNASSALALLSALFGLGISGVLFLPTLDVEAGTRGNRVVGILLAVSLVFTLISGRRHVPKGYSLKLNEEFLNEGERYYYLPYVMKTPFLIPATFFVNVKRTTRELNGATCEYSMDFTCRVPPKELPEASSPELYPAMIKQSIENTLSDIVALNQRRADERKDYFSLIMSLRDEFLLANMGAHAKASLRTLHISGMT